MYEFIQTVYVHEIVLKLIAHEVQFCWFGCESHLGAALSRWTGQQANGITHKMVYIYSSDHLIVSLDSC